MALAQGHRCFRGYKKRCYLIAWCLLGACCSSDALPLFSVCFELAFRLFVFLAFLAFLVFENFRYFVPSALLLFLLLFLLFRLFLLLFLLLYPPSSSSFISPNQSRSSS
jgi:hypothetical protein